MSKNIAYIGFFVGHAIFLHNAEFYDIGSVDECSFNIIFKLKLFMLVFFRFLY